MVQSHRDREEAIAQAVQERQREQAAALRERQQIAALRSALVQQRQIEARQEQEESQHQHLVHAIQQTRQQEHQARQQQVAQATQQSRRDEQQRQIAAQMAERKKDYLKRCASKCASGAAQSVAREAKKEYKNEYEAFNNLLGGMFGIDLSELLGEKEEVKPEIKKEEVKEAPKSTPAPTAQASSSTDTQEFPSDINDLLSHFLGLRVEPESKDAKDAKSATPVNNEVPKGLNEFLSRYGLVFEPVDTDKETEPESSTSNVNVDKSQEAVSQEVSANDPPEPTLPAPVPAASASAASSSKVDKPEDDHPLTSFLNSFADMPPFVRDILGNVEMAFKEERNKGIEQNQSEEVPQGKGKGVAEGEKKERVIEPASESTSTPTPAPTVEDVVPTTTTESTEVETASSALSTLSDISSELDLVRQSFDFPSALSFAPSPSSTSDSTPALLFNKTNSGYHAQTHKLLQLLLAADAITSNGNKDIRRKRKEVVREVEREIEGLEKRRDEVWEDVKAKRESGEIEEIEDGRSSRGSSVVDHAEVREDIKEDHVEEVTSEEQVDKKVESQEPRVEDAQHEGDRKSVV